ncbi:MAG: peptide deformylase [Nitrospinaceae bacterium]|nr:peptide deformylase [Nitrospinaceae bacterium]
MASEFDDERPAETTRYALKSRNVAWALLVSVLGMYLFVWAVTYNDPSPLLFRRSPPLAGPAASKRVRDRLLLNLTRVLAERPTLCGIAAPYLGVYERLVLLRHANPVSLIEVYNPLVVDPGGERRNMTESSLMCTHPTPLTVMRLTRVRLKYVDVEWVDHEVELEGPEAICIQHFQDVFEGKWPCDTPEGADRVPARLLH